MAYSIDTAAAIADLTAAGLEPEAARAIAGVVARADENNATKSDLETLETRMNGRMDILEAHLVAKIAIAQVATATLLFAALKFFG